MTAPEIGAEPGGDALEGLPALPEVNPEALVGSVLADRYRILKVLGQGGMGVVYLAEHVVIEKRVALKVLSEELSHSREAVNRFIYEAKAASKIGHENIIDITDFGTTPEGGVFFTMEFLDGVDLGERLKQQGALPWDLARKVGIQVCRALASAHDKGIIHRDLKPENIFLISHAGRDDFVKILDFGIAKFTGLEAGAPKQTKTGMIFGTPDYMAPEQAGGAKADPRIDIYALGIILYQLVTAKLPFEAETFMGVLHQHMTMPATPPRKLVDTVPPDFEAVILQAMAKKPEDRFADMASFAHALEAVSGRTGALDDTDDPVSQAVEAPESSVSEAVSQALRDEGEPEGSAAEDSSPTTMVAAPTPSEAEARDGSRRWLLGVVIALVVGAVGAGAFFVMGQGGEDGEEARGGSAADGPPAPPSTPAPDARPRPAVPRLRDRIPAPPPRTVRLEIRTQPPGARVLLDGDEIGRTPLRRHRVPYSQQERTLTIRKRGYRSLEIRFAPDANQSWDRILRRGRGTVRVRARARRPPPRADAPRDGARRARPRPVRRAPPGADVRPRRRPPARRTPPRDAMRPRPMDSDLKHPW
jgi:serine/threonine-protein kinase